MKYHLIIPRQLKLTLKDKTVIRCGVSRSSGAWIGYHIEPTKLRRCTKPCVSAYEAIFECALQWRWDSKPVRSIDDDERKVRNWSTMIADRNKNTPYSVVEYKKHDF